MAKLSIQILKLAFIVLLTGCSGMNDKEMFMKKYSTAKLMDRELKALASIPEGKGPFPLVMGIHGGGFKGGSCESWSPQIHRYFLDRGIVFIAVEYRLVDEGGRHPVAIRDCFHDLYWIIERAEEFRIDTARIGVLGSSAGAYLAMMVGLTSGRLDFQTDYGPYQGRTTKVKTVISNAAMYDWSLIENGSEYTGHLRDSEMASPVNLADISSASAFLLIGGQEDTDWSPPAGANTMHHKLINAGIHSELYLRENTAHEGIYSLDKEYVQWAFGRINNFLEKYLK